MNLKNMTRIAMLTALYVVLSMSVKFPIYGNIQLDLGYIALAISCLLGGWAAGFVGGIGAAIESTVLSPYGISVGWIVMNVIIGLCVGSVAKISCKRGNIFALAIMIIISVFAGAFAKGMIECWLYQIPVLVKLPKIVSAWAIDAAVMVMSIPLLKYFSKFLQEQRAE